MTSHEHPFKGMGHEDGKDNEKCEKCTLLNLEIVGKANDKIASLERQLNEARLAGFSRSFSIKVIAEKDAEIKRLKEKVDELEKDVNKMVKQYADAVCEEVESRLAAVTERVEKLAKGTTAPNVVYLEEVLAILRDVQAKPASKRGGGT